MDMELRLKATRTVRGTSRILGACATRGRREVQRQLLERMETTSGPFVLRKKGKNVDAGGKGPFGGQREGLGEGAELTEFPSGLDW